MPHLCELMTKMPLFCREKTLGHIYIYILNRDLQPYFSLILFCFSPISLLLPHPLSIYPSKSCTMARSGSSKPLTTATINWTYWSYQTEEVKVIKYDSLWGVERIKRKKKWFVILKELNSKFSGSWAIDSIHNEFWHKTIDWSNLVYFSV